MSEYKQHPASFRDPSGFVFEHNGKFYRQVNKCYEEDYVLLMKSGLYNLLVKENKILSHTESDENFTKDLQWYKTLMPEQIEFITYPYEWCFSQWKDAALLTLSLVKKSMDHGMILKDATPFNIQFINGRPVLIDSLSFEKYDQSKPWIAYRQFIECFTGPLLLAKYKGAEMLKMFQLYPDGIPLALISKLLPLKSLLKANVFLHVALPHLLQTNNNGPQKKQLLFTKQKLVNIINNLYSFVSSLSLSAAVTKWNNYYEQTILSEAYAQNKLLVIESWLKEMPVKTVLDIGTNTGLFALAAARNGLFTIAVDADTACINKLYEECKQKKIGNILAACVDITNPAPAIGWNNAERTSFPERIKTDLTMALALIHHLAIGKNISFEQMAETFSRYSPWLIIEFVPENDPKVQLLLQNRENVFAHYNEPAFLNAFQNKFTVINRVIVEATERVLFLMKRV